MADNLTKTAPPRIWLQIDPDTPMSDRSDPFPDDLDGITWCADSVGGMEVEYVRADLVLAEAARRLREPSAPGLPISPAAAEIIINSVGRALERSGVAECDDPGEAIDLLCEDRDRKAMALVEALRIISDIKDWDCDVSGGFLSLPLEIRRRMQVSLATHRKKGGGE